MSHKFKNTKGIVYTYLFSALLILIMSILSLAIKQKLFTEKYTFLTEFNDAIGLTNSTPLYFKGFEIGRLKKFTLNKHNTIDAELSVYKDYRDKIVWYSVINKTINPITGKCSLELYQGPNSQRILPVRSKIPALDSPLGLQYQKLGYISTGGDKVSNIINTLERLLTNLGRDDNADQGSMFRMLYHVANASEQLEKNLTEINVLLSSLQKDRNPNDGAVFRAINEMADLIEELRKTNVSVQDNLQESKELFANYKEPDSLLVRLLDPSGKNLIEPIRSSLGTLNSDLSKIDQLLGFLQTQEPEMAILMHESRVSIEKVQRTLDGVNNNPLLRKGIPPQKAQTSSSRLLRGK